MSVQSYRLPNPTNLPRSRSEAVFEDLRKKFQSKLLESNDDVRGAIYEALNQFFLHAGEPTFDGAHLPGHLPRHRDVYSDAIEKLAADLAVAYQESRAINDAAAASFNFQKALFDMLEGRLRKAGSTLIDLQIANDHFNEAIIVAGDDFTDTSRIDTDADLTNPRADVQTLGNLLTLKRVSNVSAIDSESVVISAEPLQSFTQKPYEGQFFGLLGQAVPEGGQFNFVNKPAGATRRDEVPSDLLNRFRNYVSGLSTDAGRDITENANAILFEGREKAKNAGAFAGFSQEEWELLGANIHSGTDLSTLLGGGRQVFTQALDSSTAIIDEGANLSERQAARTAMVDGDPNTFWQIEHTFDVEEAEDLVLEGDENNPERVGLISQALQEASRSFDALNLDVRIRLDFNAPVRANWIDLVPILFEGVEHLEVLSIQTSSDGLDWDDVPPLREGQTGNRVARDSNEDLSPAASRTVLAPAASAFAGRGLWAFPSRTFRYLRLDLRQPVPVLVPYHRLNLLLSRTVTRHHSKNILGRSRKRPTQVTETRTVPLSYPETILATTGGADPSDLAKARGASSASRTFKLDKFLTQPANLLGLGASVASLLTGNFIGGRTSYGADTIAKQWLTTHWDKGRYAIGIQDISVWQYKYAEGSEFISIPFKSPQPISKIALEVDELIPKEFDEGRAIGNWIQYWISVGDSKDWLPIAPNNNRVTHTLEGNQLPVVVNVNSGIPVSERNPAEGYVDLDHDVSTVRFRATLSRPLDLGNADELTPVLKSYRLLLAVRGGFR